MQIKALLIDLDGVIRRWPASDEALEFRCGLPAGALRRAAFAPDLLNPAITGQVRDEDWRQAVVERLRRDYPQADGACAVRGWSQSCGAVDAETLALVKACRAGLKRVLVTNGTSRLDRDLAQLGIADAFDAVVNSSVVGVAKPERQIYEICLRQAGAAPGEALFVDDTARHVQAAEALGITAHQFSGAGALRAFLRQQGVLEG